MIDSVVDIMSHGQGVCILFLGFHTKIFCK
jgi:hypothetical protein